MQTFFQKYVFVKFENLKYHQKSSIQGRGREKSLKRKLIVYVFLFFVQNFKHIRYRVTELFDFKVVYFYLGHPVCDSLAVKHPFVRISHSNNPPYAKIYKRSVTEMWNSHKRYITSKLSSPKFDLQKDNFLHSLILYLW